MKKSVALLISALAIAVTAYAQNPQSTVLTKGNTTMTAIHKWQLYLYRPYQTITSPRVLFVFDRLTEILKRRYG